MRQLLQLLSHHERGHEDSVLTVSNGSEQQRQSAFTRKADITRFYFILLIRHTNHLCLVHALIADPVVSVLCLEHLRLIGSVLRENCDFHRWTSWTYVNLETSMFFPAYALPR